MVSSPSYDQLSREQLIQINQPQREVNQSLQVANQTLQFKIDALTHELAQLKRLVFGSRSERFIPSDPSLPLQASFPFEDQQLAERPAVTQQITYSRTQVSEKPSIHPGRSPLPEHLRREVIVLEPAEDLSGAVKIGEEVTEVLELTEQQLYVKRSIRPKYLVAGRDQTRFLIGAAPDQPLPKCIAGASLLAQVVIDKYVDALPLHRQMQRFERAGVPLAYGYDHRLGEGGL